MLSNKELSTIIKHIFITTWNAYHRIWRQTSRFFLNIAQEQVCWSPRNTCKQFDFAQLSVLFTLCSVHLDFICLSFLFEHEPGRPRLMHNVDGGPQCFVYRLADNFGTGVPPWRATIRHSRNLQAKECSPLVHYHVPVVCNLSTCRKRCAYSVTVVTVYHYVIIS